MKTALLTFTLLIALNKSIAQPSENKNTPDTVSFYRYALESFGNGSTLYSFRSSYDTCHFSDNSESFITPRFFANCNEVSKEIFDSLRQTKKDGMRCKPCVLNHFNDSGNVLISAWQYTDCNVGPYLEYYSNGQIKTKGAYKTNKSRWIIWKKWNCSVKEGDWYHYTITGELIKKESYLNGQLQ